MVFWDSGDGRDSKRTLGIRDKQILWERAKHRCENPACGKRVSLIEMQPGHKKAWSRGGRTTLANSVCLCYKCNKLQGDDGWEVFLKKQDVQSPEMKAKQAKTEMKQKLADLTLPQLKALATKRKVRLSGYVEEGLFSSRRIGPSKSDYVNKLSGAVTEADIRALSRATSKPARRVARKKSSR